MPINVKDASGATVAIETPNANGRAAAASSKPVALSTEDYAAIDGIEGSLATIAGAIKAEDAASANADPLVIVGAVRQATPANTSGADGDYEPLRMSAGGLWVTLTSALVNLISGQTGITGGAGAVAANTPRVTLASDDPAVVALTKTVTTATASYTRPADTTAYASGDCLSNSASAPTAGGLTFTVASANGKGGLITDLLVTSSNAPGTPLQGELWLFDTAPTAVNDNAAFTVSDSEILTLVAKVPFALTTIGANSQAHVQGLNIGYTTVSATTLRGLVMVTNAYTPTSGEVVSFRVKTTPIG